MKSYHQHPSHLFTLRLWKEALGNEGAELRFLVQHVPSGESRIFRDELQLIAYLRHKVEEADSETQ